MRKSSDPIKNLTGTTTHNGNHYTIGHHVSVSIERGHKLELSFFDDIKDVFRSIGVVNTRIPVLCGPIAYNNSQKLCREWREFMIPSDTLGGDYFMKNGIEFWFTYTNVIDDYDMIFITGHKFTEKE